MTGLIWAVTIFFVAMLFRITALQAQGFEAKLRGNGQTLRPEMAKKLKRTEKVCFILSYITFGIALIVAIVSTALQLTA